MAWFTKSIGIKSISWNASTSSYWECFKIGKLCARSATGFEFIKARFTGQVARYHHTVAVKIPFIPLIAKASII